MAKDAIARLPQRVDPAGAEAYLAVAEPLIQAGVTGPTAALTSMTGAESADHIRRNMYLLRSHEYFANAADIGQQFPATQRDVRDAVERPREPFSRYIGSLAAMTSSARSGFTSSDFDTAASSVAAIRGCQEFPSLYRAGFDRNSPCSLTVSVMLMAVPGAYDGADGRR